MSQKACRLDRRLFLQSAQHPAGSTPAIIITSSSRMSHGGEIKTTRSNTPLTPQEDKLLLIPGRRRNGEEVFPLFFARAAFRFPLVKFTSLPSLEVGFLKYTPMKTEAP